MIRIDAPERYASILREQAHIVGIADYWYIVAVEDDSIPYDSQIDVDLSYHHANVKIKPGIRDEDLPELMAHELTHIMTAPMLEAAAMACNCIKDKRARDVMWKFVQEEEERLVGLLVNARFNKKVIAQTGKG